MKRIPLELTDGQQQRLEALAALHGKSLADFLLASALGDAGQDLARGELERLLEERLASVRDGSVSTKSVGEIFEAAFGEKGAPPGDG